MMAQAAIPLDIRIVLLATDRDESAAQVVPNVIIGSPDDAMALAALAGQCDVITFDHELVSPDLLAHLEDDGNVVWPSAASMALAQDKRCQRVELSRARFPVPAFAGIEDMAELESFAMNAGWPVVLKAARGGYDGRGVWVVKDVADARVVLERARADGTVLLAEQWLDLELEFAVLVARRQSGQTAVYPVVETIQEDGICRELCVPCRMDEGLAGNAREMAVAIARQIGSVGILAIEFFLADGQIFVNELAPRPHNSGHWTIEGACTSQFEQHLRAVLDLPLGSTAVTTPAVATVNLIARDTGIGPRERLASSLAIPEAHVHLYGKNARAGRKVGHVTACAETRSAARQTAKRAADELLGQR